MINLLGKQVLSPEFEPGPRGEPRSIEELKPGKLYLLRERYWTIFKGADVKTPATGFLTHGKLFLFVQNEQNPRVPLPGRQWLLVGYEDVFGYISVDERTIVEEVTDAPEEEEET